MEKLKKPTLVVLLLMLVLTMISRFAYAQTPKLPNITATWNNDLQQISVNWDTPLTRIPDQEIIVLQYKTSGSGWKNIQMSEGSTGKGIGEVKSKTQYTVRLRTYFGTTEYTSNQVNITTGELQFACWADWTGSDIRFGWRNAESNVNFDITCSDKTITVVPKNIGGKKSYQGKISSFVNRGDIPQLGENWTIAFYHNGQTYSYSVFCGDDDDISDEEGVLEPGGNDESAGGVNQVTGPLPVFTEKTWPTIMFWYVILASLSGVFIFLAIIRSGYQYMFSATSSPGLKASFAETTQRCIIALVVIMTAPMLVGLLIQVNDALVGVCASITDSVGTAGNLDLESDPMFEKNWINQIIAWPIKTVFIDFPNKLFGLHPLTHLVFNNETDVINPSLFVGYLSDGNPADFADPLITVLVTLIFVVFNVVFNAIYTIRGWVIIAVLCATPLIIWIWALSSQKTVIEIWLSELFQTIFMQTWHALTFAIVMSVLLLQGRTPSINPAITVNLTTILIGAGKFFASFGGIICVGIIIYSSYKLIVGLVVAGDEKSIADYKSNLQKSLIGLIILSLALIITQSIFPHELPILQPNVSGGESPKITLWQLFFAFFVILPISRMMSNIFMSLLARFGTVDEQALATGRGGMLSGLTSLATVSALGARGAFSAKENQARELQEKLDKVHKPTDTTGTDTTDTKTFARKAPGTSADNSYSGANNSGDSGIFAGSQKGSSSGSSDSHSKRAYPGAYPSDNLNHASDYEDSGIYPPPTDYDEAMMYPPLYGNEGMGIYPPAEGGDPFEEGGSPGSVYAPPPQLKDKAEKKKNTEKDAKGKPPSFQETLSAFGMAAAGNPIATGVENAARAGGHFAGATIGQGRTFADIFGAAGNASANVIKTFDVGHRLYKLNKGKDGAQTMDNLRNMTGRATSRGAIAQSLAGAALIPLGSYRAANISQKLGGIIDARGKSKESGQGSIIDAH